MMNELSTTRGLRGLTFLIPRCRSETFREKGQKISYLYQIFAIGFRTPTKFYEKNFVPLPKKKILIFPVFSKFDIFPSKITSRF